VSKPTAASAAPARRPEATSPAGGFFTPGGTLAGHPRGVFLLAATEMWERFSYWGMVGLLVLYLVASTVENGFGWERADALRLSGIYTGLVFAAPAVGGWLSSNYLGERRCIVIGGITVAFGHFLLGGPAYFPFLIEHLTGVPAHALLRDSGVKLGHLFPGALVWDQLASQLTVARAAYPASEVTRGLEWLKAAYLLTGWSFMTGLACIVIGTGFIKATISSIVGKFYARDDPNREAGFTIFMVGIWIGSVMANFVAGTLGEKLGWHYGFMAAGIGMTLGLMLYLWKQKQYLGEIGKIPDRRIAAETREGNAPSHSLTREERDRLGTLGTMAWFTIVYSTAFYQKAGLIHLIVKESTDRTIGDFEIPATWFLTISTGGFVLLAPVASWLWQRLDRIGRAPDVVQKQAMGLMAMTAGYVFLLGALADQSSDGVVSMGWIVAAYLFFAMGDVFIWPPQIAAAAKLAPVRMTSLVMGSWYVTVGLGTFLAGWVGSLAYTFTTTAVFAGLLVSCGVAAGLLLFLRPRLVRVAHGVPTT